MNCGYIEGIGEMHTMMSSKTPETVMSPMKIKGGGLTVVVDYVFDKNIERYMLFTDDLKYGNHLEIVYSDKTACFSVKNLYKLRERWYKEQGKPVRDIDNTIKKYLEI